MIDNSDLDGNVKPTWKYLKPAYFSLTRWGRLHWLHNKCNCA